MHSGRLISTAVAVFVAAASSTAVFADTKIAVGYTASGDFLPVFVAKEKGLFQKRGLNVSLTRIALASTVPAALMSDSVQIGTGTGPGLLQAVEGGLDLVIVSGAARQMKSNATLSLVARKEANVVSAADLKGKKVGVPGLNSVIDVVLRRWLIDHRVAPDSVTFIEAPFPQMGDMLRRGTIDAAAVLEPFRSKIIASGSGVRVADYFSDVKDGMIFGFWIATRAWARAHEAAIGDFRAAEAEAIASIQADPEGAKEIETKYLGVKTPGFSSFDIEVEPSDLAGFAAMGKDLGLLETDIDLNQLIVK